MFTSHPVSYRRRPTPVRRCSTTSPRTSFSRRKAASPRPRKRAAPATGAAPAPPGPDYAKLAKQIHDAVDGLGTDEEAVYTALSSLEHDPDKIGKLEDAYKAAYKAAYKSTLRGDLHDDFSCDELKHVLELLGDRSTNEKVNVANDDEATRVSEIIRQIYVQYGIDVNSQRASMRSIATTAACPATSATNCGPRHGEYKELVALKAALDHFGPIFPPMSLADYQSRIYEDPGVYRK
jgi:hypothetical protein